MNLKFPDFILIMLAMVTLVVVIFSIQKCENIDTCLGTWRDHSETERRSAKDCGL